MINTTQLVVATDKMTIKWLEQCGYKNPHKLLYNYKFPVFIVDLQTKSIFGTNTNCMAAACSQHNHPIILNLEQLKEKINL